ncbi:MAG: DUF6807 family protein, partial [Chthoniobacteraceae bacterium]
MKSASLVITVTAICLSGFAVADDSPAGWKLEKSPGAIALTQPNQPDVFQYLTEVPADSGLSANSACCFHPLRTPSGQVVTDFAPEDHKHHRGVFFAWVEMHGAADADFWGWGAHAPVKGRRIVNRQLVPHADKPAFRAVNEWLADETVVLEETLTASLRREASANILDLTYSLQPKADVRLARWAFSGFCARLRKAGDVTISNPAGVVTLPNPAHDKPDTNWPDAPWYAATWKNPDGAAVGLAVVCGASPFPKTWHNHRDLRMVNPAITGPGEVVLRANEVADFRYRVVAFDGEVPIELLSALATEGELKLTAETPGKVVDLSSEGKSDWAHWGYVHGVTILNRKQAVRPAIGDLVK